MSGEEDVFQFLNRPKNLKSISKINFNYHDAREVIRSIKVKDYYKGPEVDVIPDKPGEVWMFKKQIYNKVFYIKLKVEVINGKTRVKCISFHEDER